MKKLNKNLHKIFTLGIIGSLYLLLALNLIDPESEYLYFENRNKIEKQVILLILEDLRETYKNNEIYNFADKYIDLSKEIGSRRADSIYLGVPRHISISKLETLISSGL